jgi:anthrone oxygenase-like protein
MALKVLIIFLSLFASGLLVGNELAVAVFIHPVLYSISDEAHVRVAKPLARRLGRSMPFWYAISLVFAILQMLITRAASVAWCLCCAAAILLALIIVLTILLPAPINHQIARWNLDQLPTNWLSMRRRWDLYHRIRVLLLMVVLVLLILSALLDR